MSAASEKSGEANSTRQTLIWAAALLGAAALFAALFPLARLIDSYGERAGKPLFEAHCAGCHGMGLAGQPGWESRRPNEKNPDAKQWPAPPLSAAGHAWMHNDAELFTYVKFSAEGSPMPAFGDTLSDNQIWQVLSYLKSHWPDGVRAFQHKGDPFGDLPIDLPANWVYPPACEPGAAPGTLVR